MDVQPDTDVRAVECAACKAKNPIGGKILRPVAGKMMALCVDVIKCCSRYRRGIRPAGYAAMVKRGEKP
jgi:hypothetical protein